MPGRELVFLKGGGGSDLAIPTGQEDEGHTLEEEWRGHIIFLNEGKFPAAFFFFLSSVKLAPELNFPSLFRGQYLQQKKLN